MAAKQIIPSTDALRLLRWLALHEPRSTSRTACLRFARIRPGSPCLGGRDLAWRRAHHTTVLIHPASSVRGSYRRRPSLCGSDFSGSSQRHQSSATSPSPEVSDHDDEQRIKHEPKIAPDASFSCGSTSRQHAAHTRRNISEKQVLDSLLRQIETIAGPSTRPAQSQLSEEDKQGAATAFLRQALHSYASTASPHDWKSLKRLFFVACARLPDDVTRPVGNELVEHLLQQAPPRLEAVELLCKAVNANQSLYNLQNYLTYFCMRHTDEALQAAEARKLFQGLQRKSVPVEPEFLRPIVQTAVERGKPETAHELWTTLSADMALPPSLSIATDIIRGYGRQGSWTRIDEVITRLHNQGLSRVKPVGFAAVVRHAFNLYATFSPSAEDTYDFLTYCIQSCGVLPTPKLSSDVLYLFLRRRRYDLVQKWMKDRQVYFPGLANPANDNNTAFGIATAWASGYTHRISTLDVLATCKTLARGAVRDPFSDELRYVAQEVIESDVLACCDKLCTAVGNETMQDLATVPKAFRSYQDLHAYAADVLSRALEAKRYRNPLSKKHSTRISLLSRALKSRLIDAYEAHLLLHDFEGYLAIYGFPVYEHQAQEPSDTVTEAEEDRMTRKFSQHWRYHTQTTTEIFSHIDTVYQKLETKGEYIQRNVFFMAFTALTSIERYRSVLSLLRKLRKSKWSDRVLNGQLLALWVRTATAVTHPPALREALWAVVDSPHSIEVSARFLVLVRLAQVDLKHYHDMGWRQVTQEQLDEVEYLKKRIYRRKWCQMGCPDAEDIQERNLREWARGMTDEDFNAVKKEAAAVAEKYPVAKVEESVVQPRPTPSGAVLPLGSQLQLPTTVTKHILLEPTEEPTDTTPAESFAMHEEMPRTDDRAIPSADEQTLPASMNTSTPRPFAPWVDMPPIPGHAASSTEDHDTAPTTERRVRKTGTIPADESSKQQQHPAKADPTPHSPASPHRNIRLRSRLWAEKTKIRRRGSKLVRRLRASGQEMRLIVKRSVERPNVRYLYRGTGKSKPKLRYLRTDKVEEA